MFEITRGIDAIIGANNKRACRGQFDGSPPAEVTRAPGSGGTCQRRRLISKALGK